MLTNYLNDFDEIYQVISTTYIVVNGHSYKIEAVKGYSNDKIPYTTNAYREEIINCDGEELRVWAVYGDFPWVSELSAEDALNRALSFLKERTVGV
jgi:hypothetical protein